ncbi:hypothetical protein Plo01_40370 [Planobispora longispora]|uniref:Septum formation initiator n=2 Tax=Planobispora longispora TaxID=28887 RepID=A0A8J3RSS3_9ACTN|nr:hypothetical protein Plo01_40370 [Planobispora longispora]
MAGWLVTGALATGAGVAVITFLGEPLTASAHRPLSSAEVTAALARTTPSASRPAAVPSPAATPPETPLPSGDPARTGASTPAPPPGGPSTGRSRVIGTEGGSTIARCDDGLVTLRAWSPAQGFRVDDVDRGPAARVRVEFESDETDVKIEVWCSADGSPVHRLHD